MPENEVDSRTPEQLDAIADNLDKATNSERPMSAPDVSPDRPEPKAEKPEPKAQETYEFVHNGKPVKATRDQVLKWAQQGYDYPQRAQKLNQEKTQWDKQRQDWEKTWGVYKQIDDYAKSNKEWWDFIQTNWQNRGQAQPGTPQGTTGFESHPKLKLLEDEISQLKPIVQEFLTEKQQLKEREEDQKLDQEIQSIRAAHPDLEWTLIDENGKSLETRVLEHAQQNGIPTFRAAFRDLLHEDLVTKAQSQGKLAVAKGIQQRSKLGVLGESSTPTKGTVPRNRDIRKTSYEELEAEIREELKANRT